MNPSRRLVGLVGLAGAVATMTTSAISRSQPTGDATKACVDAYGDAQEFRKNDDLLKARRAMLTCAGPTCPAIVQNDCTNWLGQLAEAIPSVVFEAKLDDDNVFDVSVSMDGAPLANQLDGKPIEINPGLHSFVFERGGSAPIQKKVIVTAHTKSRVISVLWRSPAPAHVAIPLTVQPGAEGARRTVRPVPALFYVLGGVSVAAFGTFTVLGLTSQATEHNLESSCSPNCAISEVNSLRTRFIAADVAVGVGAVAAAAAVTVFLVRPERAVRTPGMTAVGIAPTNGGAALEWSGSF